ncbi:MAG TPA: KH domain-containing protein [Anaerolineales bacterium]
MKELVEFIAKSLVDDPTQVRVTETEGNREIRIELRVAEGDQGRVIGRNGRIANSMRSLLRVVASRKGVRSSLDIV